MFLCAGKPDPPSNCTVAKLGKSSLRVACFASSDGRQDQVFHLTARRTGDDGRDEGRGDEGPATLNMTADTPVFVVREIVFCCNNPGGK